MFVVSICFYCLSYLFSFSQCLTSFSQLFPPKKMPEVFAVFFQQHHEMRRGVRHQNARSEVWRLCRFGLEGAGLGLGCVVCVDRFVVVLQQLFLCRGVFGRALDFNNSERNMRLIFSLPASVRLVPRLCTSIALE